MYDMKYLNDFYVSEINWAETFLFEKYESAHLATAYLSIAGKQGRRHHLYTSNLMEKSSYRLGTTIMYIVHFTLFKKILSFYNTVGATWKVCNLATKEPQY